MNLTNSLGANHRNFLGFAMADVQGFVKVPGRRFLNVLEADDQNGAAQNIATGIVLKKPWRHNITVRRQIYWRCRVDCDVQIVQSGHYWLLAFIGVSQREF